MSMMHKRNVLHAANNLVRASNPTYELFELLLVTIEELYAAETGKSVEDLILKHRDAPT